MCISQSGNDRTLERFRSSNKPQAVANTAYTLTPPSTVWKLSNNATVSTPLFSRSSPATEWASSSQKADQSCSFFTSSTVDKQHTQQINSNWNQKLQGSPVEPIRPRIRPFTFQPQHSQSATPTNDNDFKLNFDTVHNSHRSLSFELSPPFIRVENAARTDVISTAIHQNKRNDTRIQANSWRRSAKTFKSGDEG